MKFSLFVLLLSLFCMSFSYAKTLTPVQVEKELKLVRKYQKHHSHRLKDFTNKSKIGSIIQGTNDLRPAVAGLSEVEAKRRKDFVSNVKYDLVIDLSGDISTNTFYGETTISFDYAPSVLKPWPLTIDFTDGTIIAVKINGKAKTVDYNNYFLSIPSEMLKSGSNKIKIYYNHQYDVSTEDEEGLHRIVENFEGKTRNYLYTQFEVYAANKMFPCFDQPNLKANYALTVKAPKDWEVITSTEVKKIKNPIFASYKKWIFPETPKKFSTYVFSLHAGPYKKWDGGSYEGRIPLKVYTRQSKVNAFSKQVEQWFTITREGFKYFEEYFNIEYPFEKYDQIIVNEFAAGAMENVGAVTFREDSFIIDENTEEKELQWRYVAMVILHEMTHMWFGDLATMNWWGDLWLNESFATYFPLLAMKHGSSIYGAEQEAYFYFWEKEDAYKADNGLKHPIVSQVADTVEANTIFDAITYNKGGSVLKQLSYYVGADNFQNGIRRYLNDFSYSNAVTEDFFSSINQETTQRQMVPWLEAWFEKNGHNSIKANYVCDEEGKVVTFEVLQNFGTGEAMRAHKSQVSTYKKVDGVWTTIKKAYEFNYKDERTELVDLAGTDCPDFVFLNYNDQDFVTVHLDDISKKNYNSFVQAFRSAGDMLNMVLLNGISFIR